MAIRPRPVGFFSYVHDDDKHEGGRLTKLYDHLVGELRMHTGERFEIFHDRDIKWREQWRQRVDGALHSAAFLFPVITPAFFRSAECRRELQQFLEIERERGRDDLVFPIYYFNCPLLNDAERRKNDALAETIAARQYFDIRPYRFDQFTSPALGGLLSRMVAQVVEALEVDGPERAAEPVVEEAPPPGAARQAQPQTATGDVGGEPSHRRGPVERAEPPTHIVDPIRGTFVSLTAALAAASAGDRIVVRPGLYREGVVIDKNVEIIGDGECSTIVIEAAGKPTIHFNATAGRVSNLTLRQSGGGNWFCVDIAQGRLDLEGCDISSQSLACVAIHAGADPWLRRNRIHEGRQSGVFVYDNGQGVIEDNEIFGNGLSGIEVKEGAHPTVRRNRIHDGKQSGILVYDNGQGVIEDNEISGCGLSGIAIRENASPTVRRNRIRDSSENGVHVYNSGRGVIEDNEIFGSGFSGIEIKEGADPTVRRNRVHDGKQPGLYVHNNGLGLIEDNDIFANARAGIETENGGNPTVRGNRITRNGYEGVWIHNRGRGTFEGNDLRGNKKGAWSIDADCVDDVVRKDNRE